MTITSTSPSVTYQGNGVTTTFSFSFNQTNVNQLSVTLYDSDGNATVLNDTQFTVTLNSIPTGSLWAQGGTVRYPLAGSPLAAGNYIVITRTVPYKQNTTISNQGPFYPQAVEQAIDNTDMQIQQLSEESNYSIRAPLVDSGGFDDLPPAAQRANKVLGFDEFGQPTMVNPIDGDVDLSAYQLKDITLGELTRPLTDEFTDERINLKDYVTGTGASGEGVNFQAALTAMINSNIPIMAPKGEYLLDFLMTDSVGGLSRFAGTKDSNQKFALYGSPVPGETVFTVDQNYIFETCNADTPRIVPFFFQDSDGVDLRNFTLNVNVNGGVATGTADALTWTGEVQYDSLDEWDGQVIYVNSLLENTDTAPTFAPYDTNGNLLASMPIKLPGGQDIDVGNSGWPAKTVPYWGSSASQAENIILRFHSTGPNIGYWEWNYWANPSSAIELKGTSEGSENFYIENVTVKNSFNAAFLITGNVVDGKLLNCAADRVFSSFGFWFAPQDDNEDVSILQPTNIFVNNFICRNAFWGGVDVAGSNAVTIDGLIAEWTRDEEFPTFFAGIRLGDGSKNITLNNFYFSRLFRGLRVTDVENCTVSNGIIEDMYGPGILWNEKDQTYLGSHVNISNIQVINPCRGSVSSLYASGTQEDSDNFNNNYGALCAAGNNHSVTSTSIIADILNTGLALVTSSTASNVITATNSVSIGKTFPCFDRTIPLPYFSLFYDEDENFIGQSARYVDQAGTITSATNSTIVTGLGTSGIVVGDILYDLDGNEVGAVKTVVGQTFTLTDDALVTLVAQPFQTSSIRAVLNYNAGNILIPPFGAGTLPATHATQQLVLTGNAYLTQTSQPYKWRYEGVDFVTTMSNPQFYDIPQPSITVSGTTGTAGLYTSFSRMSVDNYLLTYEGLLIGVIASKSQNLTTYPGKVFSVTDGDVAVTGTGFLALTEGQLFVDQTSGTELGFVKTITDDLNMILSQPATSTYTLQAYNTAAPTLTLDTTALRTLTDQPFSFGVLQKMAYGFATLAPDTTNFRYDALTCSVNGAGLADTSFDSGTLANGLIVNENDAHLTGTGYGVETLTTTSNATISYHPANVVPNTGDRSKFINNFTSLAGNSITVTLDKTGSSEAYLGLTWTILNTSTFGTLLIKNGGTTISTLTANTWGMYIYNGTNFITLKTGLMAPYGTSTAGLTAVGTIFSNALQLLSDTNVITTAAAGTGVLLPPDNINRAVVIFNDGANAIKVYTASGSATIDGTNGHTGVTLSAGARCLYRATASLVWKSSLLGAVSA